MTGNKKTDDQTAESTDAGSTDATVTSPVVHTVGEAPSDDASSSSLASIDERDRWRAIVLGEEFVDWPEDLYIPPEALEVFLEAFEGPLDLLLWLIRKQNLNILDIPVARITEQYMKYVEMMRALHLDLAAEYLVMAATLAEIKSRMLLPRPPAVDGEEEIDPRAALVRQLQQYEVFRTAALELEEQPRLERDIFVARGQFQDEEDYEPPQPEIELGDLVRAFQHVLEIAARNKHFTIGVEVLSLRERMVVILTQLRETSPLRFIDLFDFSEGRLGLVVTFSAILELFKEQSLVIIQEESFDPITVTRPAATALEPGEAVVRDVDTSV